MRIFFFLNAAVMCTVHYISPQRRSLADWGCCINVASCFLLSSAGSSDCLVLLNFHHERPDSGLFYYHIFLYGGGARFFFLSSIFHFGVQGKTLGRCMIIYVATRHSRLRHCSFFPLSSSRAKTLDVVDAAAIPQKKGGTFQTHCSHFEAALASAPPR